MSIHDPIGEAMRSMSEEAASAMDLYVLEHGPLSLERVEDKWQFRVKQEVKLRLKVATELRAEGAEAMRAACIEAVYAVYHENPCACLACETLARVYLALREVQP
jgi:chromosome segregation and condensation protein ScpB